MSKQIIAFFVAFILLAACAPSQAAIQTTDRANAKRLYTHIR